jgi:hypothetical protein
MRIAMFHLALAGLLAACNGGSNGSTSSGSSGGGTTGASCATALCGGICCSSTQSCVNNACCSPSQVCGPVCCTTGSSCNADAGTCSCSQCPIFAHCASNGGCDCNTGYDACDGGCFTLSSDDRNCGTCGNVCHLTLGYVCVSGSCLCGSSAEFGLCPTDGGPAVCADTLTDPHNCGSCGIDCGSHACVNGSCS